MPLIGAPGVYNYQGLIITNYQLLLPLIDNIADSLKKLS